MSNNNIEIEKKYLVKNDSWKDLVFDSFLIYQAYFDDSGEKKRIRIVPEKNQAIVAYKEDLEVINGILKRLEIEKDIDYNEGLELLLKQDNILVKKRNLIHYQDFILEVDEFLNLKKSLTMVEVEFKEDQINKKIEFPSWFGKDVSMEENYRNAELVKNTKSLNDYPIHLELKKKINKL